MGRREKPKFTQKEKTFCFSLFFLLMGGSDWRETGRKAYTIYAPTAAAYFFLSITGEGDGGGLLLGE